jgi:hypothetical protein
LTKVTSFVVVGIVPSTQPLPLPPWNPSAFPLAFLLKPNPSSELLSPRWKAV